MNEETQNVEVMDDDDYGVDLSDMDFSDDEDGNQTAEPEEKQEEAVEGQPVEETPEEKPEETPETFELKYNKETRKVSREEMTELAQKGLNHDRILAQRDELRGEIDGLRKFRSDNEATVTAIQAAAEAAGVDVPQFLRSLRENAFVAQGLSRDAAKERVLREEAERKLEATQAQERRTANSEAEKKAAQQKDIELFVKIYKDVPPDSIPQEVWEAVREGESLVSAYGRYESKRINEENKSLQARVKAMEQNAKNKQASVGSIKSDGKETAKDPFLEAFMADD